MSPDSVFEGILWNSASCAVSGCLLTICGSGDITFSNSSISGVSLPGSSSALAAVCFKGTVRASFRGIRVSGNSGVAITTSDDAQLSFIQSTFAQNKGVVLHVSDRSSVSLSGDTIFSNNTAEGNEMDVAGDVQQNGTAFKAPAGSPVIVSDHGRLWVGPGCVFEANAVVNSHGGALSAWGNAVVAITQTPPVGFADQSRYYHNAASDAASGGSDSSLIAFRANRAIEGSGGAIAVSGNVTLTISNHVLFQGNVAKNHGGAIVAHGSSRVTLSSGVNFTENIAQEGSGAGVAVFDSVNIAAFDRVTFQGNVKLGYGKAGAGLCAWGNSTLTLRDRVTFDRNTANIGGSGGGLAVAGNSRAIVSGSCVFKHNEALVYGGALAVSDTSTIVITDDVLIIDNKAGAAGGMLVGDTAKAYLSKNIVIQGNHADKGGGIGVMGFATLETKDGVIFTNNTARSSGADILAERECTLDISGCNIDPYRSLTVMWYREECILGEMLTESYCRPCPALTFGLNPTFTSCDPCPVNANCTGRDAIIPLIGHWHSHPYSTQVHRCPRSRVCGYNGTCAEGYDGNLCGSCASGFGYYGSFRCGLCLSPARTLAAYLGACLAVLLVLSFLLSTVLNYQKLDSNSEPCFARPADLCKVLIRHVQYLAIISTMAIDWPKALAGLFTAAAWVFTPSNPDVVTLGCLFSAAVSRKLPVAMGRVLLHLLAPLVIWLSVCCLRLLLSRRHTCLEKGMGARGRLMEQQQGEELLSESQQQHNDHHVASGKVCALSYLVVLFFFYPFLVRTALGMFACLHIDRVGPASADPYPQYALANATGGYWVSDMQQACWEGWHRVWALALGVPAALMFCVGVPLLMGGIVLLGSKQSGADSEGSTLSACTRFLSHNLTRKWCYWEVACTAQIAGVTTIAVFTYSLGMYYSLVLLVLSFASIFVLQHMAKPYRVKLLNTTASASAACLYVTASIALTFFQGEKELPEGYSETMGVVAVLVNACFILGCLYLIARHSSGRISQVLSQMEAWWRTRIWMVGEKKERAPEGVHQGGV
jgi:predicted outer membrane repeat protein